MSINHTVLNRELERVKLNGPQGKCDVSFNIDQKIKAGDITPQHPVRYNARINGLTLKKALEILKHYGVDPQFVVHKAQESSPYNPHRYDPRYYPSFAREPTVTNCVRGLRPLIYVWDDTDSIVNQGRADMRQLRMDIWRVLLQIAAFTVAKNVFMVKYSKGLEDQIRSGIFMGTSEIDLDDFDWGNTDQTIQPSVQTQSQGEQRKETPEQILSRARELCNKAFMYKQNDILNDPYIGGQFDKAKDNQDIERLFWNLGDRFSNQGDTSNHWLSPLNDGVFNYEDKFEKALNLLLDPRYAYTEGRIRTTTSGQLDYRPLTIAQLLIAVTSSAPRVVFLVFDHTRARSTGAFHTYGQGGSPYTFIGLSKFQLECESLASFFSSLLHEMMHVFPIYAVHEYEVEDDDYNPFIDEEITPDDDVGTFTEHLPRQWEELDQD